VFHPSLLKTEALKKVIAYSMPTMQKELLTFIKDKFLEFGVEEFMMTRQDIHKDCFNNKFEANYLERVLKDVLKVDQYHIEDQNDKDLYGNPKKHYKTHRHSYPRWDLVVKEIGQPPEQQRVDVHRNGRPYVFKRSQFIGEHEMVEVDPEFTYINAQTPDPFPVQPKSQEIPFQ
jgi:hypothetical protein